MYGCDDLTRWTPLGSLLTADDPVAAAVAPAEIWECPNLVRLGDRWVLIVSLWRTGSHLAGVRYLVGDLVAGPRFVPRTGGLLDTGAPFHAESFDAEFTGSHRVLLMLVDGGAERTVLDPAPGGGRARILVDGSMVEAFEGPVRRSPLAPTRRRPAAG